MHSLFVDSPTSYITKLFAIARVERVNCSTRFGFGLSGGCSYGFSSRAVQCRVVLLSNGWTPPKTNVPCHPWFFVSSSSTTCLLSPPRAHAPSPARSRRNAQLSCPITAALKHATVDQWAFLLLYYWQRGSPSLLGVPRKRYLGDFTKSRRLFF